MFGLSQFLHKGTVQQVFLLYRPLDEEGNPILDNIEDDDEYDIVADAFDELLDDEEYDEDNYDVED